MHQWYKVSPLWYEYSLQQTMRTVLLIGVLVVAGCLNLAAGQANELCDSSWSQSFSGICSSAQSITIRRCRRDHMVHWAMPTTTCAQDATTMTTSGGVVSFGAQVPNAQLPYIPAGSSAWTGGIWWNTATVIIEAVVQIDSSGNVNVYHDKLGNTFAFSGSNDGPQACSVFYDRQCTGTGGSCNSLDDLIELCPKLPKTLAAACPLFTREYANRTHTQKSLLTHCPVASEKPIADCLKSVNGTMSPWWW